MSLVLKDQSAFIIKMKDSMSKFRIQIVRGEMHETAAHPQVDDKCPFIVQVNEDMLPASVYKGDLGSGYLFIEHSRRNIRSQPPSTQFRLDDRTARDPLLECSFDVFDLG